jgi:hypothetical protein
MTDKEKAVTQAEALVRRVLSQTFGQQVSQETLSAVAEKVSQTVPANWPPQSQDDSRDL